MYTLNSNGSINVNRARGYASDWQSVTRPNGRGYVINILCAGNKLHKES